MDKRITYFTPTYNRAHTLPRLYESLLKQTNKNFVWLIIDDGSKDNTKEIVDVWVKDNKIEIEYVLKENGGKHTAIDLANQVCKTEYINCVDSDDFISSDSTESILKYIDEVSEDESLCGLVGRRAHFDGSPFNKQWSDKPEKLYFYELNKKFGLVPETNLIFKTAIIKNFHFPTFEGEKFVTESVFYNQFMYEYKLLTIKENLMLSEYQEDGYTSQGKRLFFKNPKGFLYALNQNLYYDVKTRVCFLKLVKRSAVYFAYKKVLGIKQRDAFKLPMLVKLFGKFLKFLYVSKFSKDYKSYLNEMEKIET